MTSLSTMVFALVCALGALAPLAAGPRNMAALAPGFPGWPPSFEGRRLTQLPLTQIEQRFQKNFPGRVGRFTDGEREIIIRWVAEGTRKLHSSGDCFKANGYQLTAQPVKLKGEQRWSAFLARRGAQQFAVHERIHDADGGQWSDVSAWYWAVQLGQTHGPWWAVTVAANAAPEA
ncbi:MAG: hypothetical protein WKG03_17485 [Telluria sp.]